ncbi:MAG: NADH-quinone oxidoreductase subunit, partial [Thermoproteota archaeon]|nr:NADH-quinone oxidoreductase subunit [Thermoproteota archaeon]
MIYLILTLAISALSAPLIYLLGKRSDKIASLILSITLLVNLSLILLTIPTILADGMYVESYYWIPTLGSHFTLFVDGISLSMAIVTLILCLAATVYSTKYFESGIDSSYYAFVSLLVVGLVGVFITSNLLAFYFFWELMIIPSYFIIARWGYHDAH